MFNFNLISTSLSVDYGLGSRNVMKIKQKICQSSTGLVKIIRVEENKL